MPTAVTQQVVTVQGQDEDHPLLPVTGDEADQLQMLLAERNSYHQRMKKLTKNKEKADAVIHDIINSFAFRETRETMKNGYSYTDIEDNNYQLQVTSRFPDLTAKIKRDKDANLIESENKIVQLAKIFGTRATKEDVEQGLAEDIGEMIPLPMNSDGTYQFPEGTFVYRDIQQLDATVVEPKRREDFINKLLALSDEFTTKDDKGKPVGLSPVREITKVKAVPDFRLNKLSFRHSVQRKLFQLFQNITIKLLTDK